MARGQIPWARLWRPLKDPRVRREPRNRHRSLPHPEPRRRLDGPGKPCASPTMVSAMTSAPDTHSRSQAASARASTTGSLSKRADESWRECHLHARNPLGTHGYGLLLVEQIERRAANGEDYFSILADRFTRELLGDDGYATALLEIRSRNIADEDTYWTTVTALRDGGDLDENTYGQLLDNLHARGLLDDIGYRRRRGRNPPAPAAEPLLRVAETSDRLPGGHTSAGPADGPVRVDRRRLDCGYERGPEHVERRIAHGSCGREMTRIGEAARARATPGRISQRTGSPAILRRRRARRSSSAIVRPCASSRPSIPSSPAEGCCRPFWPAGIPNNMS